MDGKGIIDRVDPAKNKIFISSGDGLNIKNFNKFNIFISLELAGRELLDG